MADFRYFDDYEIWPENFEIFIGQIVYMLGPQGSFAILFGNARISVMLTFSVLLHEIGKAVTYVKDLRA